MTLAPAPMGHSKLTNPTEEIVLKTSRFGELIYRTEASIVFDEGLVGFPSVRSFLLVPHTTHGFFWLQSTEDGALAFPVVTPGALGVEIPLSLSETDRQKLALEPNETPQRLFIVSVSLPTLDIRPNIQGPVFINVRRQRGIQQVLSLDESAGRKD